MKRRDPGLEPELEAFLEFRPTERRVPPEIRARALARGRAIIAAGGAIGPRPLPPASAPSPIQVTRGRVPFRIALAASIAIAGAAIGALAALHARSARAPHVAVPELPSPTPGAPVASVGSSSTESSTPRVVGTAPAYPPRSPHTAWKGDPFTAELELLQRAHASYTRRDFSVALALVAEHGRRFPKGQLAEQREALRVRSLEGAGRAGEARAAAAAFAVRFPRSVLLPRAGGASESAKP